MVATLCVGVWSRGWYVRSVAEAFMGSIVIRGWLCLLGSTTWKEAGLSQCPSPSEKEVPGSQFGDMVL